MPAYEYDCPVCGLVEHYQSITSATLTICPQCGKAPVTRRIGTGGAILFKGEGFWETDYNRSKDYQSKSKSDRTAKEAGGAPAVGAPAKGDAAAGEGAKPAAAKPEAAPAAAKAEPAKPAAPAKSDPT